MRSAIERKDMTVRNRLFVAWLILARFVMLSIYGCATQRQVIQDRRLTEQEVTDIVGAQPHSKHESGNGNYTLIWKGPEWGVATNMRYSLSPSGQTKG